MRYLSLIFIFLVCLESEAQPVKDTLFLYDCYAKVKNNHPFSRQKNITTEMSELKIENIKTAYFPTVNLVGQATYQSDVVEIDMQLPPQMPAIEFPQADKDQYKLYVEMNQLIYDGGAVKAQKTLEKANRLTENQTTEVNLYQLKETVNQAFFLVLLFQEQKKLIEVGKKELIAKKKTVKSGVENGVLLQSELEALEAELLKIEQKEIELESGRKSSIEVLNILMNSEIPDDAVLAVPHTNIDAEKSIQRPEYELFDYQKTKMEALSALVKTKKLPKIAAFGQLGYGKPGLNMLSNDFDTYYIVGASFSWNIWDWRKSQREQQIYKMQQNTITIQEEAFTQQIETAATRILNTIEKLKKLIEKDNKIIALRQNILKTASSQLDNGVITSTDYISKLNAKTQAELNRKIHEIELIQAKINYLTIIGN